ncbi:MAG: LCP family protein, partial [Acidimicrobiaceae bacterium]|nr:LCP family protein [Acidimicrobiaceae bacterium]
MAHDDPFPQTNEPPRPLGRRGVAGVRFRPGSARRWPRRMLIGTNVFVALCILAVGSVLGYVKYRFGQINIQTIEGLRGGGATPVTQPFTLLVVGSDTRNLTGSDNAQFGSQADAGGQRSDTMLLVRVVPTVHQMTILSIPRDLWVPIPGMGDQRINSAFNTGPSLLIKTITTDLGIPVDHYAEVNFDTFRQITDAVGGVKFWFPTPAKDPFSLLNVGTAGCVNLTGDQALGFVRSRHYEYFQNGQWNFEAESDLARIQRQQAFMKKMIKKAEGQFTNPIALNGIIAGITKNLTVDQGFTTGFMLGLARQLRSVDAAAIPAETLPTFPEVVGGADVLGLQQPQARQMIAAFNALGTTPAAGGTTPAAGGTTGASSGSASGTAAPVSPSSVAIEVANGSGVTGQATQAVADLKTLGYNASVDATPGSGFTNNVIRYAPDSKAAAVQLQGQLGGGANLDEDSSLTPSPFNLKLITGSHWNGLASSARTSVAIEPSVTPVPSSLATHPGNHGPSARPAILADALLRVGALAAGPSTPAAAAA